MKQQGFDIDFTHFRCVFNYHLAYLDSHEFVDEPETTRDLLERLSRKALDDYNQESVRTNLCICLVLSSHLHKLILFFSLCFEKQRTQFEFVKVVKANFHFCCAIMFLITFEVVDPYDNLIKLFQTRVRHAEDIVTEYVFCRPKPNQGGISNLVLFSISSYVVVVFYEFVVEYIFASFTHHGRWIKLSIFLLYIFSWLFL